MSLPIPYKETGFKPASFNKDFSGQDSSETPAKSIFIEVCRIRLRTNETICISPKLKNHEIYTSILWLSAPCLVGIRPFCRRYLRSSRNYHPLPIYQIGHKSRTRD